MNPSTTGKTLVTPLAVSLDTSFFHPITPSHSSRYARAGKPQPSRKLITAGLYSYTREPEPQYLPPVWSAHVQPEGQLYFYNSKTRVVTEAYLYNPETLHRIKQWSKKIETLVESRSISLPETFELFLELDQDDYEKCNYYYIDHESRTEFWLHDVSSDDVDIPQTTSTTQLRWALEEHYWNHVEYFPCHLKGISMKIVHDLISILSHARADHLTSKLGTFPYSASRCSEFLDLIRSNISHSETLQDGNAICYIARIWSQVAYHRFVNYHGEEHARLSRDQRILDTLPTKTSFCMKIASTALFGEPAIYERELNTLWVDDLVYADPWQQFMSRNLAQWKEAVLWTLALILIHSLFLSSSIGSRTVALGSIMISIGGLLAALLLSHHHRIHSEMETAEVATFLSASSHPALGLRPLAIAYSLPKTMLYWSSGLLALQAGIAVLRGTDYYVAGVLLCAFTIAFGKIAVILRRGSSSEEEINEESKDSVSWWRRLFSAASKNDIDRDVEKASADVFFH